MTAIAAEHASIVSAAKGLEEATHLRMSEVIAEVLRRRFEPRVAVISGPTFAREVARFEPTALVVASEDAELTETVQAAFFGPTFRLYRSSDPIEYLGRQWVTLERVIKTDLD